MSSDTESIKQEQAETFNDVWSLFQRVQDVRSALSVNVVRTIAVVLFYSIHLANYFSLTEATQSEKNFHLGATLIFIGWLLLCVATFVAYAIRFLPLYAKYLSTIADVLFLTSAAAIGEKSNSWLVMVYLLIIATTIVRFDFRLVGISTLLSLFGYITLVGLADEKWFDANHATPLTQIFMTVSSIVLCGAIGWQCCFNCRSWIRRDALTTRT